MAHIPDGVLSGPVLVVGAVAATSLLAVALRRLDESRIPHAAVLASAFFVASLLTVPLGPSSVHLLLNGLMGLLLGWAAVPAILVALILQALFFGYGGIVVLGVNTVNLAVPALAVALLVRPLLAQDSPRRAFWAGVAAGLVGVLGTGAMVAASLATSGEGFATAAKIIALTYLPLAGVEALVTGSVLGFLYRVAPDLLPARRLAHA